LKKGIDAMRVNGKGTCACSGDARSMKWMLILFFLITVVLSDASFYAAEKNAIYYNKLGWEHLKRGELFRSILNFKNALKKNPRYIDSRIGLGRAYLSSEAYDEALRLFDDVLRLDKNNSRALVGKGSALAGLGRYGNALKSFDKALVVSEENLDAKYGMAHIYYLMNKRIWAKRKLENILRANPYHYQSLILMADIKSSENRLKEAKGYIEKAINADNELALGYVRYGKILLREYLRSYNLDYLKESIEELKKALSIQPENFLANRYMGYISLFQNQHSDALSFFRASLSVNPRSIASLYGMALAYESMGNLDEAHNFLSRALVAFPSDAILRAKFEDFLILNSYKIGHPSRIDLNKQHLLAAGDRMKKKLSSQGILHLRRTLLLNPYNRDARELLQDYYRSLNYYRFYVDEMKTLLRIFPDGGYQDKLSVAIVKRRNRLYHRAGYSGETPPRDVPVVVVLDFWSDGEISTHFDADTVIANYLTFTLSQFGRLSAIGVKRRLEMLRGLPKGDDFLEKSIERIGEIVKRGDANIDFIVYGNFREGTDFISIDVKILNFHNGVIIGEFSLSETGRDNLSTISLRSSRRIYDLIPFKGRVLKLSGERVIANLGGFDGLRKDDLFTVYTSENSFTDSKEKILLRVDEIDTLVSSMKPVSAQNISRIDAGDIIYPLKKRRAKLLK
jgi:tetratricopeptide (TPR) repeat protein